MRNEELNPKSELVTLNRPKAYNAFDLPIAAFLEKRKPVFGSRP